MATFTCSTNTLPLWLSNASLFSASSEYGPYRPTAAGTSDNYYVQAPAIFFPGVGRLYGGFAVKYIGSGFTYSTDSLGNLIPTGGNYTYAQIIDNGTVLATLSNVSLPLANVFAQTVESVFVGGDNILGSARAGEKFFGGSQSDVINGGGALLFSSIYGSSQTRDELYGGGGDDFLIGGSGEDLLDGGIGADMMTGGNGSDTFYVDNPGDLVVESLSEGNNDVIITSIKYVLADSVGVETLKAADGTQPIELTGNNQGNRLIGNDGNDMLNGGPGAADYLEGGAGDDTYFVHNAGDVVFEASGGGKDRVFAAVSYTLQAGSEVETLATTDAAALTAISFRGNEYANTLFGNAGANVLKGAGGADALSGFGGDDVYYVEQALDRVYEAVGGGFDRVFAEVSYALPSMAEVETLATTNQLSTTALELTGNEFANTLFGNAGANVLNGLGGADKMIGFGGDDTYYVDHALDRVYESVGGGDDQILANATFALAAGQEIERLLAVDPTATSALNLTGNEFANTLRGNAGNNVLNGLGGADVMEGFAGDDVYIVDNALDIVSEVYNGGYDRVFSAVDYTLPSLVETLATTDKSGTASINLTGNDRNNALFGNEGENILDGRGGADTLSGFGGNDVYFVDTAGDVVFEAPGGGSDTVKSYTSYTAPANVELLIAADLDSLAPLHLSGNATGSGAIVGNAGDNYLDAKGGAWDLSGRGGDDTYVFDTPLNIGDPSSHVANVLDFKAFGDADRIALSRQVFSELPQDAAGPDVLSASAFFVGASAHDADDRIIYDMANGSLSYDPDGNQSAPSIIFARIGEVFSQQPILTAADFLVRG